MFVHGEGRNLSLRQFAGHAEVDVEIKALTLADIEFPKRSAVVIERGAPSITGVGLFLFIEAEM